MVISEKSDSTTFRLLNTSNTNVLGSATSLSIQNVCPASLIGDSFDVQQEFMLRNHALRVLKSSGRIGFKKIKEDPITMLKPMDFEDGVSSAILTIVQRKIVAPLCKIQLSKQIVIS